MALLLLVILVLCYITMTHGGMQRLLSLGTSYVQGELQWGDLKGSLVGPAEFDDLEYQGDDGTSVTIDNVQFDWHPRRLLSRELQVDNLSASGIVVRLPKPAVASSDNVSEPFQLKDLRLPVSTEVRQLSLTDIKVYPYDSEAPIVIDRIYFGGSGRESDLQVLELSATAPSASARLEGLVRTSGNWPLSLSATWQFEDQKFGQLEGRASADGNLDKLNVNHELIGVIQSTADLIVTDVTGDLTVAGRVLVEAEDLALISPAADGMPLSVDAYVQGSLRDINVNAKLASRHDVSGPFNMDINAQILPGEVQLKQAELRMDSSDALISADGNIDLSSPAVDLDMEWSGLAWPLQQDASVIEDSSGAFTVRGGLDGVSIVGDAVVDQAQAGRLNIAVDATADPQQITINSATVDVVGTDTRFDASGQVSIADNKVDVKGSWENLRWPLSGDIAAYESASGQFDVVGPLDNYQLEAAMITDGNQIPEGSWRVRSKGNTQGFTDLQIDGQMLDGTIDIDGSAGWGPQPNWDFNINSSDINPDSHWPGLDASVDVKIKSSGIVTAEGLSQNTEIVDIAGSYKGQPLDGAGGVSVVDGELVLDNLSLAAGAASVKVSGKLGTDVDLQWEVEAPSLEELLPGFKGELQISGSHSGSADSMDSEIVIRSAQVDSELLTIGDLDGTARVDLSGSRDSDISINGSEIKINGQSWESLTVAASGTPSSHKIDLKLNGGQGKFNVKGSGTYANEKWNGVIEDINADDTILGDWDLDQPVKVVAAKDEVRFRDLCISSDAGSVCAALARAGDGSMDGSAELRDLRIAALSDFFPADIGVDIEIDGLAELSVDNNGLVTIDANAGFPEGTLSYQVDGVPAQQVLGKSEFTASMIGSRVKAVADVDLTELGFVKFDADLADNTGAATSDARRVTGGLNSEIKDLSLLGIFFPQLESVQGALKSNLSFSGALDSPRITGSARVDDLSLEVPSVAVQVTDGAVQISGNGKGGLLLRGSARSGAGQLTLDGNYSASTGALQLGVAGEDFRISNTSRQRIDISPDLNIQLTDNELSISGDLLVPTALIKTGGGSSVVVESPDVVIIDSNTIRKEKKQNDLNLDVKVSLGDNIRVDAGQFDGALSGGLTVNKKPGQVITGSGIIEVVSGDFLVYGQKLTMENGKILFSGGPIDNPALDLDVAREVAEYDVKAGVRVTGSAQTPILELNSDPPQTDANTLSFIVLGKPVDALGASYTLGRYITPELYVSFGFDLFDRREIFTLRYQLSNKLALIGSSSRSREPSSGADLIYTLER